jgi:putative transposase
MPRRARTLSLPGYFHLINRAAAKAPLFVKPREYREFLQILREGLRRHPVPVIAYCVLSNHWHLLIGPTGTKRLTLLMHWVSTTHAVRFRRRRETVGEGPVYQGRFKSKEIEDAASLVRIARYIERNALTAGLVRRAQDWPWCSLSDRRREDPAVPLKDAEFLGSDTWVDYVNQVVTVSEQVDKRRRMPKDPGPVENRPVPKTSRSVENRPVPNRAKNPRLGAKRGAERGGVVGRADGNEADTHVERAKHFGFVELAGALKPREQRRNGPAAAIK